MRKKAVQIARLSDVFLMVSLAFAHCASGATAPDLLSTWFPLATSPSCKPLTPTRLNTYDIADSQLTQLLQDTRTAIQQRKSGALTALFHPRLTMQVEMLAKVFEIEKNTVGVKHEVSDYQLWALRPQEKDHNRVLCEEEPILIDTLYGYPLQMGYWIQTSGSEDLGRFFVLLVHDRSTWRIGGFRFQRWTYLKKNAEDWAVAADASDREKHPVLAFFQRDLAQKLLAGETRFTLPQPERWKEVQGQTFSTLAFETRVQKALQGDKAVYIATALSPKGHSLLLRFGMDREWSSTEIRSHCEKVAKKFWVDPEFAFLQGMRCGYVFPKESREKDGVMGSVYVERDL